MSSAYTDKRIGLHTLYRVSFDPTRVCCVLWCYVFQYFNHKALMLLYTVAVSKCWEKSIMITCPGDTDVRRGASADALAPRTPSHGHVFSFATLRPHSYMYLRLRNCDKSITRLRRHGPNRIISNDICTRGFFFL